ncbi:hypothetical protein GOP47_0028208 [Adiantum capillus-veneris]|nr:hypothetical protein GOP47_0028208 [Adiantum capillus-veneris]
MFLAQRKREETGGLSLVHLRASFVLALPKDPFFVISLPYGLLYCIFRDILVLCAAVNLSRGHSSYGLSSIAVRYTFPCPHLILQLSPQPFAMAIFDGPLVGWRGVTWFFCKGLLVGGLIKHCLINGPGVTWCVNI